MFAIVALALVVSLDGLAAGIAYGAKRIRLPFCAVCLISVTSALTMYISMSVGNVLRELVAESVASFLGAALLIAVGTYFLFQYHKPTPETVEVERDILHVRIASLGLVIRVWHDPLLADSDSSGGINPAEAFVLGLALALDAFGAGLGAAMTGLPPLLTAFSIGVCKFMLVNLGIYAGSFLAKLVPTKVLSLLPGLLLILLGAGHLL